MHLKLRPMCLKASRVDVPKGAEVQFSFWCGCQTPVGGWCLSLGFTNLNSFIPIATAAKIQGRIFQKKWLKMYPFVFYPYLRDYDIYLNIGDTCSSLHCLRGSGSISPTWKPPVESVLLCIRSLNSYQGRDWNLASILPDEYVQSK